MGNYQEALRLLKNHPKTWLITGVAGFIGSNLLEQLLLHGQKVAGLDNFATGHPRNLEEVRATVGDLAWANFQFIEGDIRDLDTCRRACQSVDILLHHAALGSVPRSLKDPLATHQSNVDGFLNMLIAARDAEVSRIVYASSSSVYGDDPGLPKVEDHIGRPLSPYALTKRINEDYAAIFTSAYSIKVIGLRYFNVFGKRQDPSGPYAAVIPIWASKLLSGEECVIFGDGETSRDFCYVANVVQANILAGTCPSDAALGQVLNVSCGDRITLRDLFEVIREKLQKRIPAAKLPGVRFEPFRKGDIAHSQADIARIIKLLGYQPSHKVDAGMEEAVNWYIAHARETA